jgi:hypothetical protein
MAEAQAQEKRGSAVDAVVVTGENFDQYVAGKLPPKAAENEPAADSPEAKAAEELKKVEEEKAARLAKDKPKESEGDEIDHPDKDKKKGINERFSKITAERKAAEENAAKAAAEAKAAREGRDKAEAEAKALRDKYEPPKSAELGPEPQLSQFTDVAEYTKAIKDWTADKTRKEDATKAQEERQAREQAATAKAWQERQAKFKAETPDYEKTIAESEVKVSDQVRDAILDSEVGPAILHHLAKNPDVAVKWADMTVSRALKEVGKLEAALQAPSKESKAEPKTKIAEISSAPAPITPLRGASAPVVTLHGHDDVPQNMTYEDWKKLYSAGKIK